MCGAVIKLVFGECEGTSVEKRTGALPGMGVRNHVTADACGGGKTVFCALYGRTADGGSISKVPGG